MVETYEPSVIHQVADLRECDVFISFDFEDFAFVQKLQEAIKDQKLQVWNSLPIGVSPHAPEARPYFAAGIANSTIFVAVISPASVGSTTIRQEIELAQKAGKHLVLIFYQDVDQSCLPVALLEQVEWITIDCESVSSTVRGADPFDAVAQRINQTHICIRLLQRTEEWQQKDRPANLLLGKADLKRIESWDKDFISQRLKPQPEQQSAIETYITASFEEADKQKARPLDVIISYSRKDKAFVERLCAILRDYDINFWVDWENIPVAVPWRVALAEGIRDARKFLFVMSSDSVASKYCFAEIEQASQFKKPMISMVLKEDYDRDKVHPAIRDWQWLYLNSADSVTQSLQEKLPELMQAITEDPDYLRMHTNLLVEAMKWSGQEYKKDGKEYRWIESKRDPELLLKGKRLQDAERWLKQSQSQNKKPQPTRLQAEFIQASQKARARRWTLQLGSAAILGSLISFGIGFISVRTAGEIRALVSSLEGKQQLDALMVSLKAGKSQKSYLGGLLNRVYPNDRAQVVTALNGSIYNLNESNRLEGHTGRVYTAIFNKDGLIASAGQDKFVNLWKPNGERIKPLGGHTADVTTLDFSPDGQTLASADNDGLVKLWDVKAVAQDSKARSLIVTLTGHQKAVYRVRFSHDGRVLATASVDGTVKLWSLDGKLLKTLPHGEGVQVNNVIFSQDDQTLVSASSDGVRLWQWTEPQPVAKQISDQAAVSMDWSPDNQQIAIAGFAPTVWLWNRQNDQMKELTGHQGRVRRVAFSHSGKLLASVSDDYTIRLWTPEGKLKEPKGILRGHEAPIRRVLFSYDDEVLATADENGVINLWRVEDGTLLDTFVGHRSGIMDISMSQEAGVQTSDPETEKLVSAGVDGTVRLWKLRDETIQPLSHENQVFDVLFSSNNQFVISAGYGSIRLWQTDGSLLEKQLYDPKQPSAIPNISISPDGRLLASAGLNDGKVKLWRLSQNNRQPKIEFWKDLPIPSRLHYPVRAVSFSSDGKFLASGGDDQMVRLWNADGSLNQILAGHRAAVTSLAFSPDGTMLASSSQTSQYVPGEIILWSVKDKKPLQKITTYPKLADKWNMLEQIVPEQENLETILSLAFSPDGKYLAAADSKDNSVKIWRLIPASFSQPEGRMEPFKQLMGHAARVLKVSYRHDGLLASASEDGTVRLWTADGNPLTTLKKHRASVNSVAFSPNQQLLASASDDQDVLLWQLPENIDSQALETLLRQGCTEAKDYMETNRNSDPVLKEEQEQNKQFCEKLLKWNKAGH